MIDKILVFFWRLSQLPKYLKKIEKIIVLVLSGLILVSLLGIALSRFFVERISLPDYGGTYIEGEVGEIRSLIPILKQTEVEKDISKLVFSSLIEFNQKREIVGDLAEKWEIAPDGKIYIFRLKEVKWHDGRKLTADDVVFTFSLIQSEQTKSPLRESFQEIEVKKIDDKTISFGLKTPLASFLTFLSVPILPQHLLSQISLSGLADSQFGKKPIGSGPFKLTKIEKTREGTSVILKANENYYSRKPYLSKFVFKVYDAREKAQLAFSGKKIHGLLEKGESNDKIYKITLPQIKTVFFNLNSVPDKDLRKALILATNKKEIIEAIGRAEKADFPILPNFLGYKESEKWEFNLEKAKDFFNKAKNKPPELTLLTNQSENNQKIAEILQKQWQELGIKINLDIQANGYFEKVVSTRNYDILLIGSNQKADPDPYPYWHSSQATENGSNFSGLKNKEVDKLLEEGRQAVDVNARKQRYEKFVDIIQSEVPAIFLYQPIYSYRVRDIMGLEDIQGVSKADRFWNVEHWYVKTKRIKK